MTGAYIYGIGTWDGYLKVLCRVDLSTLTFLSRKYGVGVFNVQGPPVPIPNTVVKLHRADNT